MILIVLCWVAGVFFHHDEGFQANSLARSVGLIEK